MSTVRRFKQNDNIDADDLSGDDVIPIEHDPSGEGDEDRALTVKQAKKYIYDNLPMTYNGTATIDNNTGLISATISDIDSSFSIKTGFRFRLVFSTTATYSGAYKMAINGGTAYSVTINNIAETLAIFVSGRSYEFLYTGSNFDCITTPVIDALDSSSTNLPLSANQGSVINNFMNNFKYEDVTTRDGNGIYTVVNSNFLSSGYYTVFIFNKQVTIHIGGESTKSAIDWVFYIKEGYRPYRDEYFTYYLGDTECVGYITSNGYVYLKTLNTGDQLSATFTYNII